MSWTSIFLMSMTLMMPGAKDCSDVEAAHNALLKSSFSAERIFTLKLNGTLKVREVTRLTYIDGKLTREVIEKEVFDKNVVLEEGDREAVLRLPFACERLKQLEQGKYELSSSDGTEKVVFVWSRENQGTLQPVSWENFETKRFLWKKLVIKAVAEYKHFVWQ